VSEGVALASRRCAPCEGGTSPLTEEEARAYLAQLHRELAEPMGEGGWELVEGKKIIKTFRLKGFREAIALVNRVAELAEAEGHHPDIWVSYRRVRFELTTHAIGGLSENDFIMAAKIEALAAQG